MQDCLVGYRKRWGKVSQLCVQAGQGVEKQKQQSWVIGGVWKWGSLLVSLLCTLQCCGKCRMGTGFCTGSTEIVLSFDSWWWERMRCREGSLRVWRDGAVSAGWARAALFLNNDLMESTWLFFRSSTCARAISVLAFASSSSVPAWRSQELLTGFCYLELSELWLQLIWQHCCHGNEDFIVHYPVLAQGKKSNFLWLLPPLERLVKQTPLCWGFVATSVKALGRKMQVL